MDVRFKNSPTQEELNHFCQKVEKFLSAHNLKLTIKLFDFPGEMTSSRDGQLVDRANLWIGECYIESQATGKVRVRLFREGIESVLSDKEIWYDASYIQDQIYSHLKLTPEPPDSGDPYWKLWAYWDNK